MTSSLIAARTWVPASQMRLSIRIVSRTETRGAATEGSGAGPETAEPAERGGLAIAPRSVTNGGRPDGATPLREGRGTRAEVNGAFVYRTPKGSSGGGDPDAIPAAVSAGPQSPRGRMNVRRGPSFAAERRSLRSCRPWLVDSALITAVRREALVRSGAEGLPSAGLPRSGSRTDKTIRVATRRMLARALESARP